VASTHFEFTVDESDMSHLVAQALFADGAASIIVAPEGEWRYTKTGMSIVPNSEHLLGLMPPHSPDHTSYKMTLHKDVGQGLINYFSDGVGKELMRGMYDPERPKPALSIHPGGPKILDSMHVVFRNLGWPEDCMAPSYETLQSNGNLGAAAMLFVLSSRLSKPIKEDTMITMAFGPGVTVEWATLEKGPRKKGFDYKAVLKVIQHILVVVGLFYLIQVALEKNGIVIKL
jgi:predicted naringenin-chalcone synthase